MKEKPYLSVIKKKGEMDFCVYSDIMNLSPEEMNDLRAMLVVAIGTAESMWRRANEKRHPIASAQPGAE